MYVVTETHTYTEKNRDRWRELYGQHYINSTTHNSFTTLKILFHACSKEGSSNQQSFSGFHGFAYSRMSYSWNHTECSFFRLLFLINMHLKCSLSFQDLISHFFLALTNIPLYGSVVGQWCPTLCKPMDCSTTGFPVLHHLPKFAQTHVH